MPRVAAKMFLLGQSCLFSCSVMIKGERKRISKLAAKGRNWTCKYIYPQVSSGCSISCHTKERLSSFEFDFLGVQPYWFALCQWKSKKGWLVTDLIFLPHMFMTLTCWGAWDTICRHNAKNITPLFAWRMEAWEEEALDDLPWKDEKGPLSIRRTLELSQWQRWGNFERRGGAHMGFSQRIVTILNWTELWRCRTNTVSDR